MTFNALKSINYFTDDADIDYWELYDIKSDPNNRPKQNITICVHRKQI